MREDQFYTSNNLEKYPDGGKLNQCKKCITMHVDNWNPDTILWILQEIDVPWIPDEWNKLLAKHGQDPKATGMSILGRYFSKMKLAQYKNYRWKDTEPLQKLAEQKIEQTMKKQGYDAVEIASVIQKGKFEMPDEPLRPPVEEIGEPGFPPPPFAGQPIENSIALDLTDEDKTYLCIKWGRTYRPDEWVQLEQLYEDMMQSYDIQSAGDKNTLILVCKSSLKANQLMDLGDIDGAQKATKMYDSLMKQGKWTAQQNKAEKGEYVDSISELVAICEADGFIPRFYVDGPQDKVDRVIQDMEEYTRTLITEEMHLGSLIERAVEQIEVDKANEVNDEDMTEDEEAAFENNLFDEPEKFLTDQDFMDFQDFEEEEEQLSEDILKQFLEED